jgi:hypothetical protein
MLLTLPQARKALFHASMCLRMGEGYSSFFKWARTVGTASHSIGSVSNTAGILETEKETMVAFQGTDDVADILLDLECKLVPSSPGRVHEGFLFIWKVYEPQFLSALKKIDPKKERPVSVTGHSLGAALAAQAGACVALNGYVVKDSFLFGSPRTGDAAWVDSCGKSGARLLRIVNDQDLVTRLPFWAGYKHLPEAAYLDKRGLCSDSRPFSLRSIFWDSWAWALPESTNDHWLSEYARKLSLYLAALEGSPV